MSVAGFTDVGVDLWGGYCPAIPPSQLPAGASPNCQDVIFPEACVRSRPRLSSFFPSLGGNPTVNGIKTYANALANIMLVWDSLGNLYQEATPGNLTLVQGGGIPGLFFNSTSLFGREYMAFFDGKSGQDSPRQFDGTNYDRVSQTGPGMAPGAADENVVQNLAASPNGAIAQTGTIVASPNGLSQVGFIVTVTVTLIGSGITNCHVGDPVAITGAGVAGYNGNFTIASIGPDGRTFTYVNTVSGLAASGNGTAQYPIVAYILASGSNTTAFNDGQLINVAGNGVAGYNTNGQTIRGNYPLGAGSILAFLGAGAFGLAASGNGTITNAGNIAAGKRQLTVAFITRQGFITCPAVPTSWTATGGKRVVVANIPTGPPNVVARLLLFTQAIVAPATTGQFFSLPTGSQLNGFAAMQISDNTTTTITVDFLDSVLAAGFNGQYLFAQVELGECASVNSYNSRTVWIGERNKIKADGGGGGLINLTFDGGFSGSVPLGWVADVGFQTGAAASTVAVWGQSYTIGGDGATAIRGRITQPAATDYLGNQIIRPNTSYSARVRLQHNGVTQGNFVIELFSATQGSLGIFSTVISTMPTARFGESIGVLLASQASIPNDLILRIYANGTINAGASMWADNIEIFPTNAPVNLSLARISHANNPESFDGLLDVVQIAAPGASAGVQMLRASWQIRTNLYLAKDHYLCYVTDDGQNEPAAWSITEVSNTIGCCGPNAWDGTEEWVVFSERSGQYITTGSDPVKIVQEIQEDVSATGKPNWNATNWLAGYTVWTRIDRMNKRILTGLPLNGAAAPNLVFQMDYKFSPTGDAIVGAQAPTYSAFTGRILVHGSARKWAPWNVTANCCSLIERPDGTSQTFLGNGLGNGKIYSLVDASTQGSDDGTAVNDFYETYGSPSKNEEEALQLGQHRKICEYLTGVCTGSGLLSIQATSPYRTTAVRAVTLNPAQSPDFERRVSVHGERIRWRVGTNAIGNWFQLERLIPSLKADPVIPVRGLSA